MSSSPVNASPTPSTDTSFFGHPRGLATLFFTEMWERYSFYGTRALLISIDRADLNVLGGANKELPGEVISHAMMESYSSAQNGSGYQPAHQFANRFYGGILIGAGNFCLVARSVSIFYAGLGLMMIGTGLLKANVSTLVGSLYAPGDKRRDSGFSIFYMGINIGAFASPIVGGIVAAKWGWRWGFLASAIGMAAGLTQYVITGKDLGAAGLHPVSTGDPARDRRQKMTGALVGLGGLALIGIVAVLAYAGTIQVTPQGIRDWQGWGLALISVAVRPP